MRLGARGGGEYFDARKGGIAISDIMVGITSWATEHRIAKKDKVALVKPPPGLGAAAILSGAMMVEVGHEVA